MANTRRDDLFTRLGNDVNSSTGAVSEGEMAKWDSQVTFKRSNPVPLDKYSVFKSKTDAENYASENGAAYPGQIITVVPESGSPSSYCINSDGTLSEVGKVTDIKVGETSLINNRVVTLGTAAQKGVDTVVTENSTNLITSGAVKTAIDELPEPMIFKGTLGTGGTITTLPAASASNEGYTYKVITADTYQSKECKVGDVVVSCKTGTSTYEWVLIPAGDTDSDTWREIKVNGNNFKGTAISTGLVNFKNGSNVSITTNDNDISIASTDTGATSVETTGSGNAVTSASYDASTRKITLTKGTTFLTSESHVGDVVSVGATSDSHIAISGTTANPTVGVDSGYSIPSTTDQTTWTNKQDALSTQTAYTSKGTATKVPQITTNTLGQVTNIEEVTISQPTVNNNTITIKQTGIADQTFTLNQNSNKTITLADNNTIYTFTEGTTDKAFTVTPSGGTAQTVSIHGLGDASLKDVTSSSAGISSSSTDDTLATAKAVYNAINNLPEPMVFKGGATVTISGITYTVTITNPESASEIKEGFTYKITSAPTNDANFKVGDTLIADQDNPGTNPQSHWTRIPSGDDVEDTWRNIRVNGTELLGSGISSGAVNFKDGGNITVSGSGNDITFGVASGYSIPSTTDQTAWSGKQEALPTTTTAGKILKSTSTAGTVEWGYLPNADDSTTGGIRIRYDSSSSTLYITNSGNNA